MAIGLTHLENRRWVIPVVGREAIFPDAAQEVFCARRAEAVEHNRSPVTQQSILRRRPRHRRCGGRGGSGRGWWRWAGTGCTAPFCLHDDKVDQGVCTHVV
jgi:hypothetical protein